MVLAVLTGKPLAQTTLPQPASPSLDQILDNMERVQWGNPARFRAYMLTREYKFFQGDDVQRPKSQVTAQVSFEPPNHKSYDILETRGSGRGEAIVKHMLENETELSKDISTTEFSRRNYNFALLGEAVLDGRRCYVLALQPKRQERSLFVGKLWVAADDSHLLRAEGKPAKSPSWWLKSSYVVLDFGDVDGLWLPVATHGTGDVRLFGRFQLESRKVGQQVEGVIARGQIKRQRGRGTAASSIGAAVLNEPQR
jgi:hypothetical protein